MNRAPDPDLVLSTARLVLRAPQPGDWEAFAAFAMSGRAATLGGPHDLGRAWRMFAGELGHWQIREFGMWAVTRHGAPDRALALVGPWCPADWPENEIGWMVLDAGEEGTGIAAEAARAAIDDAFGRLGWSTAVSYIKSANARSVALAERLGARPDPAAPLPASLAGIPHVIYRHPNPRSSK